MRVFQNWNIRQYNMRSSWNLICLDYLETGLCCILSEAQRTAIATYAAG